MNEVVLTTLLEYKVLSETDNAIFIETKNGKRIIHNRSIKFPARSTIADLPDSVLVDDYNLNDHIKALSALEDEVADFIL